MVSLNLHRRHLTSTQLAVIANDMLPMIEAEAKERQRDAGGDKVSEIYKEAVAQQVAQPVEKQKPSIEIAADMVGTNKEYVGRIKRIAEDAPVKIAEI